MGMVGTFMAGTTVDNALIRALREGPSVLPGDLHRLHAYLMLISGLLAEKACEHEPTLELADAAGAETDSLYSLEAMVAERAARVEARRLVDVANKLAIWAALEGCDEGDGSSPRDRLVQSVRRDLDALLRDGQGDPGPGM